MAKQSTLKIVYKKIAELTPLDKNPRKISDDDFERLRQSVESLPTYFEARPLLINDESGQLIVYAGNQRLKAAKKLGLKEIPCIVETLTHDEQDERMIRDNIANGEWDFDILRDDWSDLDLEGMGLELPDLPEQYNPKQGEVDIDALDSALTISLKFNEMDYNYVKGQFALLQQSPEQWILEKLGDAK